MRSGSREGRCRSPERRRSGRRGPRTPLAPAGPNYDELTVALDSSSGLGLVLAAGGDSPALVLPNRSRGPKLRPRETRRGGSVGRQRNGQSDRIAREPDRRAVLAVDRDDRTQPQLARALEG